MLANPIPPSDLSYLELYGNLIFSQQLSPNVKGANRKNSISTFYIALLIRKIKNPQ